MSSPDVSATPPSALVLRGVSLAYLGVMVLLPLAALLAQAAQPGLSAFIRAMVDPFAWHALMLSVWTAAVMVAINAVMGTLTAWVLVRYEFPGKWLVNALIDLPFAVPTVVTGLMLVALYGPTATLGVVLGGLGIDVIYHQPGIILALLFVGYPFVVRSVQPVLMEMDRTEEEAAATLGAGPFLTFIKVILPTLRPSILTGSTLAFSRALGEFGSVVMVAGNRPLQTKTGPMYVFGEIESANFHGALVVSVLLLACSLGTLLVLNQFQGQSRQGGSHGR